MTTDCIDCPLRRLRCFEKMTPSELAFMRRFKSGELVVGPRTTILPQGSTSAQLYTAFDGWGVRYKLLPDGQRQVINFVLPGDLVGLQAGVLGEMQHGVDSVTRMTLCVFARADLWRLFETNPSRAFDITWLSSREEYFLGDMLAVLGRRTGVERISWGLLSYYGRVARLELATGAAVPMPFRQQDLADAFGLSLVHTNKTLRLLQRNGLIEMAAGTLTIRDMDGLKRVAGLEPDIAPLRPLI